MSNRNNDTIRQALQKIAWQGKERKITGVAIGGGAGSRITGFVKKIHDQEDDELFGTIDVQEFNTPSFAQEEDGIEIGLHEGVFLSAIQNNRGYLIVPKLYSEVTIASDPETQTEYVVMFSHVDLIQLDSHEKVSVGVREREAFDVEDEDGDDINDLKLTGIETNTTYTKDSVTTTVVADKDKKNTVRQVLDADGMALVVGDDKSKQTVTQDKIVLEHNKTKATLDDSQARIETNNTKVVVKDGTVYVGDDGAGTTDDAVLGQQLASLLAKLTGYLGQILTPTMMGPQMPTNQVPNFMALQAEIQQFAAAHSGFLTKKVQIQK